MNTNSNATAQRRGGADQTGIKRSCLFDGPFQGRWRRIPRGATNRTERPWPWPNQAPFARRANRMLVRAETWRPRGLTEVGKRFRSHRLGQTRSTSHQEPYHPRKRSPKLDAGLIWPPTHPIDASAKAGFVPLERCPHHQAVLKSKGGVLHEVDRGGRICRPPENRKMRPREGQPCRALFQFGDKSRCLRWRQSQGSHSRCLLSETGAQHDFGGACRVLAQRRFFCGRACNGMMEDSHD